MAAISRLKVGQVVYTVTNQRMGNTTMRRKAVHPVLVKEIDLDKRRVFASWNYNQAAWYCERVVLKWKVNKPKASPLL